MTRHERPFLTARWTDLLLLNFPVPTEAIAQLTPPGTDPDLFDGQAYISIVGFQFRDTRVRGCAWPAHTNFPEINLRYYVRRVVDEEVRRGVVFVCEIVPRRLIAIIANRLFHENYVCRPMRGEIEANRVVYSWQSSRSPLGPELFAEERLSDHEQPTARWNTLSAHVTGPLALPPPNSFDEFLVEHYWGYAHGRDGRTREYRVTHAPWRVAPVDGVTWDCGVAATYHTPLAKYLIAQPTSAIYAEGATVKVFRGHKL